MIDKDAKITLHYFNSRGRGEIARFILHFAKKEFTDHRVEREDWPNFKLQTPLGQMPMLEFVDKDGKSVMLCQSSTITRQLANAFDLAGKTPEEIARADEAFESLKEVMEAGARAMFEPDLARKENQMNHLKTDLLPRIFGYLEKRAAENGGKNLAGGEGFTYADLTLAMMSDAMNRHHDAHNMIDIEKMASNCPILSGIIKEILESPALAEYLATRPETDH